jgi:hypothetical protein
MASAQSLTEVWSFGVFMWEVFSNASLPYAEVRKMILDGICLKRPVDCPKNVYELMQKCWNVLAQFRPTFSDILRSIIDLDEKKWRL